MMTGIGNLTIDLIAQTASFNANISKSAQQLNGNAAKMNRSLQNIEAGFGRVKSAVVGFAAVAGGSALVAAGGRALDYAASLGEISQQVGVTIRDLQVYRYAATQVNVTQEEMEKGLQKLTSTIGKAGLGSKTEGDAFRALGIEVRNASGHFKTAGDIMPELADRLAMIPDPAKRAAVEVALFGRAGQKLDPLLSQGSKGLRAYGEQAEKLGVVLSDDLSNAADKASDRMAELKMQLEANFARTVAENANSILFMANSLSTLAVSIANFWAQSPDKAYAIIGGLAGGRVGGLPAAAIGAVGGYVLGGQQKGAAADANLDIDFRKKELQKALDNLKSARQGIDVQYRDKLGLITVRSGDTMAEATAKVRKQTELLNLAVADSRKVRSSGPLLPEFEVGNFLDTSGGGKGKTDRAAEQAAKLLEQFRLQGAELEGQLNVLQLRNAGFTDEANALEDQVALERELARIREQYKGLDPALLNDMEDMARRTITLTQETERFQDKLEEIDGLKIEIDVDFAAEMGREVEEAVKNLPDLRTNMQRFWDEMEAMAPHAFDTVTRGIEDAILGFSSMGDAIRSVVAELASMALQAFVFAPLKSALGIPGFAAGTDFAPGGLAIVGERGPELVNLPRGSKVTPNHRMNSLGFQRAAASIDRSGRGMRDIVVNINGAMDERAARRTGMQVAASARAEMARSAKLGY